MINLSVIREHSLENSDFTKKALINDGDRPYIRRSKVGMQKSENRGQMKEDRRQRTEDG